MHDEVSAPFWRWPSRRRGMWKDFERASLAYEDGEDDERSKAGCTGQEEMPPSFGA